MGIKEKLKNCFGTSLRNAFLETDDRFFEGCEEIRIRLNKEVLIKSGNSEYFLKNKYAAGKRDINEIIELISDYSPYSFAEEMKNGFITIEGGFRIGLCGTAVVERGSIIGIKGINSINIRVCREVKGCADRIIDRIAKPNIKNTIIISPPGCGKTTLLRDIVRNLSCRGINIGVVDERNEISGAYKGICVNDLGSHTDVYSGCPKPEGILMLLRAMSPKIICVDEINGRDCEALESAAASGVNIICTAHAKSISDIEERNDLREIFHIFDAAVILSRKNGAGTIEKVYMPKERS